MKAILLTISIALLSLVAACANPEYVRDTDDPEFEAGAMSTGLDRTDIDRLYQMNAKALFDSKVVRDWEFEARMGRVPVVAVFPMRNETAEYVGPALNALLSKMETDLVNNTAADVVSHENQPDLIAEIQRQQQAAYDPARLAAFGRQMGAQFFVTGKVHGVTEKTSDARRTQYFMFMQVIEVATGKIHFQNESKVSKGLR